MWSLDTTVWIGPSCFVFFFFTEVKMIGIIWKELIERCRNSLRLLEERDICDVEMSGQECVENTFGGSGSDFCNKSKT